MAGNDDLHPILSKIHRTIGDVLKEVQKIKGEVEKIREAVTRGFETVREAIHESIQAQAELKMMEQVAQVREIRPQIRAEHEHIEHEREELDRQLERIADRYDRKHEELDEKAARRVRDLGSHIFEIDEEEFEEGIEAPFAEHVTTVWGALQAQNETVKRDRREQVESTAGDLVGEIREFVDRQHELVDRIQGVRTDVASPSEPTTLQVPYYVVTVESGGTTERHVVTPSRIDDGNGAANVSLQSLPGMERLVSPTELNDPTRAALDSGAVKRSIEPYLRDDPPLVSYGRAIDGALPDRVEVAMEGGE
jgi:uncharacterized protein YoxC